MNMVGRERGRIKFMVATVFMVGLPHDRHCSDLMVGLPIKPLRVREDKSPPYQVDFDFSPLPCALETQGR